jgi:hypothetical protein
MMKNIWNGIVCLALCLFLSVGANAQQKDTDKTDKSRASENDDNTSDREITKRLSQDVYSRKPLAKDAVIVWDNTDEGYDGAYAINDEKYVARYDKQGNYVETLVERKWDDKVPANVRSSYDNSMYKSKKVEHFWEVDEPSRKGYYLEVKDDDGKSRRIWSDREGKFSDQPRKKGDY